MGRCRFCNYYFLILALNEKWDIFERILNAVVDHFHYFINQWKGSNDALCSKDKSLWVITIWWPRKKRLWKFSCSRPIASSARKWSEQCDYYYTWEKVHNYCVLLKIEFLGKTPPTHFFELFNFDFKVLSHDIKDTKFLRSNVMLSSC